MSTFRRSIAPERYQRITLVALILLVFIIVTGAAVRLTGSGLGCSDWPTCEKNQFVAEIDDLHAMVEFVNRVITGLVSAAVIAAVLGSMRRLPRRRDLIFLSWGLVAGVLAQILLGALVVREHLPPTLVLGHFLLSMVLVWNGLVLYHRAGRPESPVAPRDLPSVMWHARVLTTLAAIVLVTGTFVTGTGPHSGSETQETKDALAAQGVDVTQLNPEQLEVERLPFDAFEITRVHSVVVLTFLAVAVWLALRLRRPEFPEDLFAASQTLVAALVVQAGVGYAQYFSDVPALLVGLHVAGSVAVWLAVLNL
ncbi:MAG: heme A synthase, partial [Acidimicrobiales bacterium]